MAGGQPEHASPRMGPPEVPLLSSFPTVPYGLPAEGEARLRMPGLGRG